MTASRQALDGVGRQHAVRCAAERGALELGDLRQFAVAQHADDRRRAVRRGRQRSRPVISSAPSPASATTSRSGLASFAPIAAGTAYPMHE